MRVRSMSLYSLLFAITVLFGQVAESKELSEAKNNCMLKEYYARNGKTDSFVSKEYVDSDDALGCFRSAMIKAELSKKDFIRTVSNKKQYHYVYWEFNDGYIWDSDGYVTRYTRDCTYRKVGSDAFNLSQEQYSYTMSASYYLYKQDCHTFNDY